MHRRDLLQLNHTLAEIDAIIADIQSDIALQPEVDNAAENRLQKERKEHDEYHSLVVAQSAKKAKYDQQHETAKVSETWRRADRQDIRLTLSPRMNSSPL